MISPVISLTARCAVHVGTGARTDAVSLGSDCISVGETYAAFAEKTVAAKTAPFAAGSIKFRWKENGEGATGV